MYGRSIEKQEIFYIVPNRINLITHYSFWQSCSMFHKRGSDNPFQRYVQFYSFEIFQDGVRPPLGFGLTQRLKVDPFDRDRQPRKPHPRTIYEVDRMTRCECKFLWPFEIFQKKGRSVGQLSKYLQSLR